MIKYLNDVEKKYSQWVPKYDAISSARTTVVNSMKENSDALAGLVAVVKGSDAAKGAALEGAIEMLKANNVAPMYPSDNKGAPENAVDYTVFLNVDASVLNGIDTAQKNTEDAVNTIEPIYNEIKDFTPESNIETVENFVNNYAEAISGITKGELSVAYIKSIIEVTTSSGSDDADIQAESKSIDAVKLATVKGALNSALTQAKDAYNATHSEGVDAAKAKLAGFYGKYASGTTKDGKVSSDFISNELAGADGGQGYMATVMQGVAKNILNNKTLKTAVQDKMGAKGIALLNSLSSEAFFPLSANYPSGMTFKTFKGVMEGQILDALSKAKNLLAAARADGLKSYKAGKAKIDAGQKKYNKALADYKVAPAQLAEGREQLEEGRQKLADGRKELAAGKEKLAEYEDGEQQVRDGLATLMESQRYADLETILERRNGDDNFDAADKSLDIPDGLNAVGTGREYQSATGEIITAELGGRILGSGLELGAAAIAVLAAVLSLLKKFKGAAVSAVAAAAMGVSGIIAANNAGMEMSTIAGSNMGATPVLAAGILAAVAAVFSVVHFTANKDA